MNALPMRKVARVELLYRCGCVRWRKMKKGVETGVYRHERCNTELCQFTHKEKAA